VMEETTRGGEASSRGFDWRRVPAEVRGGMAAGIPGAGHGGYGRRGGERDESAEDARILIAAGREEA